MKERREGGEGSHEVYIHVLLTGRGGEGGGGGGRALEGGGGGLC